MGRGEPGRKVSVDGRFVQVLADHDQDLLSPGNRGDPGPSGGCVDLDPGLLFRIGFSTV